MSSKEVIEGFHCALRLADQCLRIGFRLQHVTVSGLTVSIVTMLSTKSVGVRSLSSQGMPSSCIQVKSLPATSLLIVLIDFPSKTESSAECKNYMCVGHVKRLNENPEVKTGPIVSGRLEAKRIK